MGPNPKVDFFFDEPGKWSEAFNLLRDIVLENDLDEILKWGQACYTLNEKNIVLIHGFKDYCALLFFKGALFTDPENLLIQQSANVQAARQFRFTNTKELRKYRAAIKGFIQQAIQIEKSGVKVVMKKTSDFEICPELETRFKKDKKLKLAFDKLTPGRQRAYLLHFSSARQPATREARITKAMPAILAGKGLNE